MKKVELISEASLRHIVRERIARLIKKEGTDADLEKDQEQNPLNPASHQPPEPPSKDIMQKGADTKGTTGAEDVMSKTKIVEPPQAAKPKDVNDPTASPVDLAQLKNERIARFIQTVSNTSKQDLQFIINDTAPDTKAKTIKLFLKLIGVSPNDVSALLTSTDQTKPTAKDKPAQPPVDEPEPAI